MKSLLRSGWQGSCHCSLSGTFWRAMARSDTTAAISATASGRQTSWLATAQTTRGRKSAPIPRFASLPSLTSASGISPATAVAAVSKFSRMSRSTPRIRGCWCPCLLLKLRSCEKMLVQISAQASRPRVVQVLSCKCLHVPSCHASRSQEACRCSTGDPTCCVKPLAGYPSQRGSDVSRETLGRVP